MKQSSILVVDDDQLILYALARALKDDAHVVETADTATAAIKKVSECPFDLCLLDVHLTDMNGLELMKRIRETCPETKFIIMTASCLDASELSENHNEAIANGACHFIPKPFNLWEVTDVVQQVLTGKENFEVGFRFTGRDFEKKSRKTPRKPYKENIRFQMSVIDQGNYTRWSLEAEAVDISDSGIGLLSQFPLKESQIIGFDEKMGNRTGVVAWSKMIDAETCRAGIRFA
jgi:CheY-like chemotaxis protein